MMSTNNTHPIQPLTADPLAAAAAQPAVPQGEDVTLDDAAQIMATLKPTGPFEGGGVELSLPQEDNMATTKPTVASTSTDTKKKRKKYNTSGSSNSSSGNIDKYLKRMDDSQFLKCVTQDFKRRGYTVAIQLTSNHNWMMQLPPVPLPVPTVPQLPLPVAGGESDMMLPPPAKVAKTSATNSVKNKSKNKQPPISPLILPNFPFYPSTTSITQKNIDAWNIMFNQLQVYYTQNNGTLPTTTNSTTSKQQQEDPNYAALLKWTKAQLALWKRMRKDNKHNLSLDRISKLHSLNFEAQVDVQRYAASVAQQQDTTGAGGTSFTFGGNNNIDPMAGLPTGVDINLNGGNINNGAAAASNNMNQQNPVDSLMTNSSSGKNAQKWQDKFDELVRYKNEFGNTAPSRNYNDSLSKWCATQRLRCKEILNGEATPNNTPMTKQQFLALQSIGFDMSQKRKSYDRTVLDKNWDKKFNELVEFKQKHGNCDVAVRKGFEEYKQLANWAGLQRRKFKAKQTGSKAGRTSEISDEQINKLASIGFSFSLQDDFETRYKHLMEYKKEFGHTKVPVFYTGYNNLGRWAKRMRDGIRNNEPWVDESRRARLLGVEFDLAPRHIFTHKQKNGSEEDTGLEEAMLMDEHAALMLGGEQVGEPVLQAANVMVGMEHMNHAALPVAQQIFYPQHPAQGYPNPVQHNQFDHV